MNTTTGIIEEITFDDFLSNKVARNRVHHTIEKYNVCEGYSIPDKDKECEFDSVYQRITILVVPFSVDNFKKQFLEQLADNKVPTVTGDNLADLVEEAAIHSLENFGLPDHVIKLETNKYVVVDSDAGVICLKLLDAQHGAFIVYAPYKCCLIELEEKIELEEII